MTDNSKKNSEEGPLLAEKFTLEVMERGRLKRLEFASEEDRAGWNKAFKKSKWYTPYFLVGVGINLLLYKLGVDLARNILLGALVGVAVPLGTMFLLTELHYQVFIKNR